uniref:Uncharacterized protein n=1 Tax=Caenorhabditis japonica TaxID=281687 RepID=A0A2Q4SWH4_CAEJA
MKVSSALAEIVSEFSGFQHIRSSSASSYPTSMPAMTSSLSRHSLNIAVGVQPISRTNSFNSLNDFQGAQRKDSTASSIIVIE